MNAISVDHLTITYKNFKAVDDVTFSVKKGEVFGIIGPNGAGKTSTLECIEGLRENSGGTVDILGIKKGDRNSLYKKIGVQLQETKLQDNLKVMEIIKQYASFYENPADYNSLLLLFELQDHANFYIEKLSGGQKQRLSIILALIGNPEILFLDEISTGLDPYGRKQIWEIIEKLRDGGKTILMTTHFMEEAELLCDRVCMFVDGKIRAIGTLDDLIEKANLPIEISLKFDDNSRKDIQVYSAKKISCAIKPFILSENIIDIDISKPSLEDVFLAITGAKLEEAK